MKLTLVTALLLVTLASARMSRVFANTSLLGVGAQSRSAGATLAPRGADDLHSIRLLDKGVELHATDRDEVLLPYFKRGYRKGQSLAREDAKLGLVHAVLLVEGEGLEGHRSLLFVFATRAGQRTLIHRAEYAWAALERLVDIDADGRLDLVVRAGNGGNCWTCGWVEAVTLGPTSARVLVPAERFQQLEDVDGDGVLEGVASDARWEFYEGLCHACSPRVARIHRLSKGAWIDASAAFPAYYRMTVETLALELERQARSSAEWDEYQFGTLASILLNRLALGETGAAWKDFDERIAAWRAGTDPDGQQRLDALVTALRRDAR